MKLLIADEDSLTRNLIMEAVSDPKVKIVVASEGVQAWQLLSAADPPRLAILDWVLVGMSGLDICRKLRHRDAASYTYVILIGARPAKADLLAAFQSGADDYITKPFEIDELLCRLGTGWRVLEKEGKLTRIIKGWRTMLDNLPFGVACLGHSGQLLRANMVFVDLVGFTAQSMLGKSLNQTVLPDGIHFPRLMKSIRESQAFDRTEMEITRNDGSLRTLVIWGRPIPGTKDMVYQIIISLP